MVKEEKEEKALVRYDKARLEENVKVGMRSIDSMDIRPPQMLLLQALSDFSQCIDKSGLQAEVGQFFHTGKMEIYDSFECYFLFVTKTQYVDRRKPEEGKKDQYNVIGVLADDLTLFAETFRSSALYALSRLFTSVISQKRPMYSFLVKMETKKLSSDKGEWFVPVLRILKEEADPEKLMLLEGKAKALDMRSEELTDQEISDVADEL